MTTVPVFALLALNLVLFLVAIVFSDKSSQTSDTLLLNLLFFCSDKHTAFCEIDRAYIFH